MDGKLVVEKAESAYKARRFVKVPLMIGSCHAEISGNFVNMSQTKDELFSLFGSLQNEARAAYDPEGTNDFAEVLTKFNSDWVWGEPARMTAKAFTNHGMPAYVYLFSYVPNSLKERMKYGAGHGSEVAYTFNNLGARWGVTTTTPEDEKLGISMNTYWVNFAKTGNPNGSQLPNWPLYSTQKNEILEFENNGIPVSKKDPTKERLDVIEKAGNYRGKLQSRGI